MEKEEEIQIETEAALAEVTSEAAEAVLAAIEEADSADLVRCIRKHALDAEKNAKFHLNQQKENLSIVGSVSQREEAGSNNVSLQSL